MRVSFAVSSHVDNCRGKDMEGDTNLCKTHLKISAYNKRVFKSL